jgi:hypothetical protein
MQYGLTLCKPSCTVRFFFSAIGEMDIITVFETVGGGSIPSWPAKYSALSIMDNTGDFYSLDVGSIPAGRTKTFDKTKSLVYNLIYKSKRR